MQQRVLEVLSELDESDILNLLTQPYLARKYLAYMHNTRSFNRLKNIILAQSASDLWMHFNYDSLYGILELFVKPKYHEMLLKKFNPPDTPSTRLTDYIPVVSILTAIITSDPYITKIFLDTYERVASMVYMYIVGPRVFEAHLKHLHACGLFVRIDGWRVTSFLLPHKPLFSTGFDSLKIKQVEDTDL